MEILMRRYGGQALPPPPPLALISQCWLMQRTTSKTIQKSERTSAAHISNQESVTDPLLITSHYRPIMSIVGRRCCRRMVDYGASHRPHLCLIIKCKPVIIRQYLRRCVEGAYLTNPSSTVRITSRPPINANDEDVWVEQAEWTGNNNWHGLWCAGL